LLNTSKESLATKGLAWLTGILSQIDFMESK